MRLGGLCGRVVGTCNRSGCCHRRCVVSGVCALFPPPLWQHIWYFDDFALVWLVDPLVESGLAGNDAREVFHGMGVETYPTPWFGRCCFGLVDGHKSLVAYDVTAVGVALAAIDGMRACPELKGATG
eukprot:4581320-Pyramimonas_sp.AAC.1